MPVKSASIYNLSIPENVLSQELNSEVVLLNMDSEFYYSLNPVGSRMWQLLTENGDIEVTIGQLLQTYTADEAELYQDVMTLVEELVEEGLLVSNSP